MNNVEIDGYRDTKDGPTRRTHCRCGAFLHYKESELRHERTKDGDVLAVPYYRCGKCSTLYSAYDLYTE